MCVHARARSIKSAIEFVCAHIKDMGWLVNLNVRGDRRSSSLWLEYLPTALDSRCVWGVGVGGIDLTIEVQWLVYVWRRRETYLMY